MVPEKGKVRAKQASLLDAPEDKPDSTDSLVAKAFDSDPKVRLKVAQELAKIDDPRAVFALIELSSDKEEAVKVAAQKSLGSFKEEAETIVSLEKMLAERKEQKAQPSTPHIVSQSMAPTIEKLFSHYEPQKRESVKRKLFPSLQKLFGFSKQDLDPMQELEKIGALPFPPQLPSESGEKEPEAAPQNAPNFPFGQKKEPVPQKSDLVEIEEGDHEPAIQSSSAEAEFEEDEPTAEEREHVAQLAENRLYSLAYRIATTPGMGKSELKREQNRLTTDFRRRVELAFKLAAEQARLEAQASQLQVGNRHLWLLGGGL